MELNKKSAMIIIAVFLLVAIVAGFFGWKKTRESVEDTVPVQTDIIEEGDTAEIDEGVELDAAE